VSMRTQVPSLSSLSGLRIGCCCGCSVGQQLQLPFNPEPGNLHMPQVWPYKDGRKEGRKEGRGEGKEEKERGKKKRGRNRERGREEEKLTLKH